MENIKNFIPINWILIGLTIPLYFVFIGILFHILLGIFQVSIFILILLQKEAISKAIKIQLWTYGIITTLTLLTPFIYEKWAWYAWISSCILAFYFTGILYQLKNN